MSGHVSRDVSGVETVASSSVPNYGSETPHFPMPSFKKAALGFAGSIVFFYGAAFFLSALI